MRRPGSRVPDALPAGRLVAAGGAATAELVLEPGPLGARLEVAGLAVGELAPGTLLRIGGTAVVALGVAGEPAVGAPHGGLVEAAGQGLGGGAASLRPATVVAGGTVRAGDPAVIEAVPVPVEAALDLHPFAPEDARAVVEAYLAEACAAGLREVRVIHGRGRGVQRAAVRRVLAGSPLVAAFRDAPPEAGGWGATLVELRSGPGGPA